MTFPRTLSLFVVVLSLVAACGGTRSTDRTVPDSGTHDGATADDGGGTPDLGGSPDLGGAPDLGTPDVDMGTTDVDMGSTGSGACTNSGDQAILMSMDVSMTVGNCAMTSFGAEPATQNCIRSMTGLSNPCADCFDGEVRCSVMNCAFRCFSDTPDCAACRATFCDGAFQTCSGLAP